MRESNLLKNFCESREKYKLDPNDYIKVVEAIEEAFNELDPDQNEFIVTLRRYFQEFLFNEKLPFNFVKDFDLERETIFGETLDDEGYEIHTEETRFTAIEILYLFVLRATYVDICEFYDPSIEFENMYFITRDSHLFRSMHFCLGEYIEAIDHLLYVDFAVLAHPLHSSII